MTTRTQTTPLTALLLAAALALAACDSDEGPAAADSEPLGLPPCGVASSA